MNNKIIDENITIIKLAVNILIRLIKDKELLIISPIFIKGINKILSNKNIIKYDSKKPIIKFELSVIASYITLKTIFVIV